MQVGNLEFRTSIIATLGTIIVMTIFLAMGIWQLQRSEEKKQILREYEASHNKTPVHLELPLDNIEAWRYRKVHVNGVFDTQHQFLLDNQVSNRQVGYSVITPLKILESDYTILVDRGWVPLGDSRDRLPAIDLETDVVDLTGSVYVPFGEPYSLGEMDSPTEGWPRVIQFLDFELLSQRIGTRLPAFTLRLDESSRHAYRQDWQVIAFTPQRHLAYAFQWFAMAAVLLMIYLWMSIKGKTHE